MHPERGAREDLLRRGGRLTWRFLKAGVFLQDHHRTRGTGLGDEVKARFSDDRFGTVRVGPLSGIRPSQGAPSGGTDLDCERCQLLFQFSLGRLPRVTQPVLPPPPPLQLPDRLRHRRVLHAPGPPSQLGRRQRTTAASHRQRQVAPPIPVAVPKGLPGSPLTERDFVE